VRRLDEEVIENANNEMCNVFAVFWNLCKARLPRVVTEDIERFLFDSNISRMDGGTKKAGGDGKGSYTVGVAGKSYTFRADLAPPTGAFAGNYARAIHKEYQPHEYSVSWVTTRDLLPETGGNFFMAEYGVRIEQAPNTAIVWKPKEFHGTSLHGI
ncbi:hypothetical protein BDN72DRAFT_730751, partial [Pluteus cervinus]